MTGLLLGSVLWSVSPALGQEFDCRVSVDFSQLPGTEYTFLSELERKIGEYVNQRSWTDDRFLQHERIECSIEVYFQEAVSVSEFRARLVIQTRRPIYNTTQSTTVVRFSDSNWQFDYTEGAPLTHTPDRYDPLTSVLDFYVYLMLGYDYDTFSEMGGTPYFEEAREIAEQARGLNESGWSNLSGERSRAELIDQLLDTRYEPLRRAYFTYHFGGLDHFISETEAARTTVMEVLRNLQRLYQETSRSYAFDQFLSAKSSELVAILRDSKHSSAAYDILTQIHSSSDYDKLVE